MTDLGGLIERFPNSAAVQRRQLAVALAAQDVALIRSGLARLAELGYAPGAQTMTLLAPHVPVEEMTQLRLRFEANRAAVQASRLFALVPESGRLIEGVAWDAQSRRLFATAVVGRELIYGDGNVWRAVPGLDAGSLAGIAIDAPRRRLWVASRSDDRSANHQTAFRGLIGIDLDTLRQVHRIPMPGEGAPGDIAVGADGTVYAADPLGGTIWRLGLGDGAMTALVPPGRLLSPQGMVAAPDRRRLYVADYLYGIAIVDTFDGSVTRLESASPTMLDGIDGMVAWREGLVAIQNGTSPFRIVYLALNREGTRIERAQVVESGNPEWGEPTLGVVMGRNLLYVADSQGDRYGPGGAVTGEGPTRPTAIRVARLPR